MKRAWILTFTLVAASAVAEKNSVPGQFIVKFKPNSDSVLRVSSLSHGQKILKSWGENGRWNLVQSADGRAPVVTGAIDWVEPNYIYRRFNWGAETVANPNDARFSEQWALNNTGQKGYEDKPGKPGADVKALEAWNITRGSKNVVVAVVDSGIDVGHVDLRGNIWEMPGNKNVHGRNFVGEGTPSDNVNDDVGHGTHVAGIIGAVGNNGRGIVGVNWKVSLMAVKSMDKYGGTADDLSEGIYFALQNNAHVINASWGGEGFSQLIYESIEAARNKGVLVVAAAGNGGGDQVGDDNDTRPVYPASYALDNIISVAASDNNDELPWFSNYGAKTVHVMAPGLVILSTLHWNRYAEDSGTSMSTPFVTGAAALLWSKEPSLNYSQVKQRILESVDILPSAQGKTVSGGRLNVARLVNEHAVTP